MAKKIVKKTEEPKAALSAKNVLSLFGKLEKEKNVHAIELRAKEEADYLSAGSLVLSLIMGGGYYGGQVFQIYGPPGVGKSSLVYSAAAFLHKLGIPTAFFDHEGTTDAAYIDTLGMDRSNKDPVLKYYRPESGNDTYEMLINVCNQLPDKHHGLPQLVVFIDSVATMAERNEFKLDESKRPAVRASMHSKYWGMLKGLLTRKHVSLVATNQVRSNVGNQYQNPESIPGGNAWQFSTDNLVRIGRSKQTELPDGGVFQLTRFKTHKNKNFIPMQEGEVYLHLGQGFDPASDAMTFAKMAGYLTKDAKGLTIRGLDKFNFEIQMKSITKALTAAKKTELDAFMKKSKELVAATNFSGALDLITEFLGVTGLKIDGKYPSPAALEAIIRQQKADGTNTFYNACAAALSDGEAVQQYRASKDKTKSSDEEDVGLANQKATKSTSLSGGDEEIEDEEGTEDAEEGPDEDESSVSEDEAEEDTQPKLKPKPKPAPKAAPKPKAKAVEAEEEEPTVAPKIGNQKKKKAKSGW